MYLLDTNVISELRKPRPHGAVVAWIDRTADEELHLSAVTLGELQAGVEITRERDPNKAAEIEAWIDLVAQTWNVLPVDARVFRSWATLMHRRPAHLIEDALIAATAIVHHLTVVTRNTRDFAIFEVETLNPFATNTDRVSAHAAARSNLARLGFIIRFGELLPRHQNLPPDDGVRYFFVGMVFIFT